MEPEVSLPHTQTPATCPYPELDESSPCTPPQITLLIAIILPSNLGLQSCLFPSVFPTKILHAPLLSA